MSAEALTDRRDRILRAAAQHFAGTPYGKVSTVAIAADAEVNRGWLYHEFGSKRDLYLAVLQRTAKVPELPRLADVVGADDLQEAAGAVV
uniref:TetR/AcrR family transcriptional regulator n=1 Tax=Nocardioides stalactiti TaxID=2755356 RepID=UPI0016013EA6